MYKELKKMYNSEKVLSFKTDYDSGTAIIFHKIAFDRNNMSVIKHMISSQI